jgi:hypothetical protein
VLLAESIAVSLRPNCVLERVENSTRVWVVIRIFRVSPNKKRKRKEMKEKLKQVIKSQTKAKKGSLE